MLIIVEIYVCFIFYIQLISYIGDPYTYKESASWAARSLMAAIQIINRTAWNKAKDWDIAFGWLQAWNQRSWWFPSLFGLLWKYLSGIFHIHNNHGSDTAYGFWLQGQARASERAWSSTKQWPCSSGCCIAVNASPFSLCFNLSSGYQSIL